MFRFLPLSRATQKLQRCMSTAHDPTSTVNQTMPTSVITCGFVHTITRQNSRALHVSLLSWSC